MLNHQTHPTRLQEPRRPQKSALSTRQYERNIRNRRKPQESIRPYPQIKSLLRYALVANNHEVDATLKTEKDQDNLSSE